MLTVPLLLAVAGVAGIVFSYRALGSIGRSVARGTLSAKWATFSAAGHFVGFLAGFASWPLSGFLSYPVATPGGTGRFAGLPFAVTFFDEDGLCFGIRFQILMLIGNGLFWFLSPQAVLWLAARPHVKREAVPD